MQRFTEECEEELKEAGVTYKIEQGGLISFNKAHKIPLRWKFIKELEENKMENENKIIESPHSVKFSMNAKGQISGECKCYAPTPEEALTKASGIMAKMEVVIKEKNNLE